MAGVTIRYAQLDPNDLVFNTDSGLTKKKIAQLTADVIKHGFKNPISVKYDGKYTVTWGRSRAFVAQQLKMMVPAVIFEARQGSVGEIVAPGDVQALFDSPVVVKDWRFNATPKDNFWT